MALKKEKVKKRSDRIGSLPQTSVLLNWYDRHRRLMPWRPLKGEAIDPYRVWLSEVMLQQTTVAMVGPYFQKFIKRWPSLNDLAAATLDDVLRMWAGLGYYRRARMLHQCARILRDHYNGIFPREEKELLDLPGFGPYTAAAVISIAFDKPANVVDGNVERVMARIFAVQEALPKAKTKLRKAAALLVPLKRCGDYAQALMDLGATICTPRSPKCGICPWQSSCRAYKSGIQESLPRRTKTQTKPIRRTMAFVLKNTQGAIFLRQRSSEGLLGGMMEVPSSPWHEGALPELRDLRPYAPKAPKWVECEGLITHVFSHFSLEIKVMVATAKTAVPGVWIEPQHLAQEALPSVMKKIIHHALKTL